MDKRSPYNIWQKILINSNLSDILQLPLPSPASTLRPLDAPVISAFGDIVDLTGSAPFLQLVEVADLVGKPDEVFADMNERHFRGLVVILHERLDGGGFLIPENIAMLAATATRS